MKITDVYPDAWDYFKDIENVVSLVDAKFLKDKGFNKKCFFYYLDKDIYRLEKGLKTMKWRDGTHPMNHNRYDEFIYSAPLKSVAQEWLKKNKIQYELES